MIRRHSGGTTPPSASPAAGRIAFYQSHDGLRLAARIFEPRETGGLPVLCLPGLSRNSRDFIALGQFLSRHATAPRTVVALDYRGRGHSEPDPDWRNYAPHVEAGDVLAGAAALSMQRAVVVGTSRGGIIATLLATLQPDFLAGVVLNDIGPVIECDGLARIKAYLSARRVVESWNEAVDAVRTIGGGQFPALSDADWRAFAEAYFASDGAGRLAPQFDPNLVRTIESWDGSEPSPTLWPQFESLTGIPVLAIRGELSDILSPSTLNEMAERHPKLEQLTASGQGHAPLLRDGPTLERILAFVRRCESGSP